MLPQYPPQSYPPPTSRANGNGMPPSLVDMRSTSGSSMPKLPTYDRDQRPSSSQSPALPQRRSTHSANPSSPTHHNPAQGTRSPSAKVPDEDMKPSTSGKKRSRRPSAIQTDRPDSSSGTGKPDLKKGKGTAPDASVAGSPPAVLVREKKQKACSNCRRAKLKCIIDDGETDCVRCTARKERCVFYPRSHVSSPLSSARRTN